MGFDDIVFDNRIEQKTKTMLNGLIGYYDYENWDDLESMETGTQVYSAYSLIWRQLYNINLVMMVGMSPFGPNPEMKQKLKKHVRKQVLEMFKKKLGPGLLGRKHKHYDKIVALHLLSIQEENDAAQAALHAAALAADGA